MTSSEQRRRRIVVGEPGLARALRDAGHEVVYTGPDHTCEQIVATAIQEDADLIGLAASSDADAGALVAQLAALLKDQAADDIVVKVYPEDRAAR